VEAVRVVSPRAQRPTSETDVPVVHVGDPAGREPDGRDRVVVEEPLEVRVGERSLLVTMRTPGADFDLVRGLLFTEELVADPEDIGALAYCRDVPDEARGNVVTVSLVPGREIVEENAIRIGLISSACGVCGKSTLEAISTQCLPVAEGPTLTRELLMSLPDQLRGGQTVFDTTGGLHAAALFDRAGRRLALAEDVGRHNTVDKIIGEALRFGRLPLRDTILLVSGRAGFEIIQKARRAGIPVVASVSAPSSLAVDLARDGGQTLIGFLREGRFNVYCGEQRFDPPL
jgi:FdhD protein